MRYLYTNQSIVVTSSAAQPKIDTWKYYGYFLKILRSHKEQVMHARAVGSIDIGLP